MALCKTTIGKDFLKNLQKIVVFLWKIEYNSLVILNALMLCPKTWKMLLLLEEHGIDYKIQHMKLNTPEKWPTIDNYHSDLSFIFANLEQFISSPEQANSYGFWMNFVECTLIPEIIMQIRHERVIKPIIFREYPNLPLLKDLRTKLKNTLKNVSAYLKLHKWLDQNNFGISDVTLASALAILDYLGEISWHDESISDLYAWYMKVKSRPTFQIVLQQRCQGIAPHGNFMKIDF